MFSNTLIDVFENQKNQHQMELGLFAGSYFMFIIIAWLFNHFQFTCYEIVQIACVAFVTLGVLVIVSVMNDICNKLSDTIDTLKMNNQDLTEEFDVLLETNTKLLDQVVRYEEIIQSRSNSSRSNSSSSLEEEQHPEFVVIN